LRRPLIPATEITYKFLAPVLSVHRGTTNQHKSAHDEKRRKENGVPYLPAQLTVAATGRPRVMRNLAPEVPPRPLLADIPVVICHDKTMGETNEGKTSKWPWL